MIFEWRHFVRCQTPRDILTLNVILSQSNNTCRQCSCCHVLCTEPRDPTAGKASCKAHHLPQPLSVSIFVYLPEPLSLRPIVKIYCPINHRLLPPPLTPKQGIVWLLQLGNLHCWRSSLTDTVRWKLYQSSFSRDQSSHPRRPMKHHKDHDGTSRYDTE